MRILTLLFGLALILGSAGCLDYRQEIVVNPDGSGSSTVDFGMADSLLTMDSGESADSLMATRNKFIALRDRLKANPAVRDAQYREYRENDLQHFVVRITLADITRLNELQDELAGGATGEPGDSGNRSKLTMQRRADGSTSFRYLLAVSQSALPGGGNGQDERMNAATREMIRSAFAGRFFTIRLRGSQVQPEPSSMAYGSLAADGSSLTWQIPFSELFGGENFSRELLATVSGPGRQPPAREPAGAMPPHGAVYTGSTVPTLPGTYVNNFQQRLLLPVRGYEPLPHRPGY